MKGIHFHTGCTDRRTYRQTDYIPPPPPPHTHTENGGGIIKLHEHYFCCSETNAMQNIHLVHICAAVNTCFLQPHYGRQILYKSMTFFCIPFIVLYLLSQVEIVVCICMYSILNKILFTLTAFWFCFFSFVDSRYLENWHLEVLPYIKEESLGACPFFFTCQLLLCRTSGISK